MIQEQNFQTTVENSINQICREYKALKRSTTFSLNELFSPSQFNLKEYCETHQPHPNIDELAKVARAFGKHYKIWLPSARNYITCSLFLFPTAPMKQAESLVKNLAVDFYLNDTIGRDRYPKLSVPKRLMADALIKEITQLDERLQLRRGAKGIEQANIEMLTSIRETSSPEWFNHFLHSFLYHVDITHKDTSAKALGYVPSVKRYIGRRMHISGMVHTIALAEYCERQFLDKDWLKQVGVSKSLRKLHQAVALFGCLANDFFSFEKEVIDEKSDANLIATIALKNSEWTFEKVIREGAMIVQNAFLAFQRIEREIRQQILAMPDSTGRSALISHLQALEQIVKASWTWQVSTKRYKRPNSIWKENRRCWVYWLLDIIPQKKCEVFTSHF